MSVLTATVKSEMDLKKHLDIYRSFPLPNIQHTDVSVPALCKAAAGRASFFSLQPAALFHAIAQNLTKCPSESKMEKQVFFLHQYRI